MRYGYVLCVMLLLASCQTSQTPLPQKSQSFWYDMGFSDAMSGLVVKDNETLVEGSGNPDVDRADYLKGYHVGQTTLCHSNRLIILAKAGSDFPASCDGTDNADQLRDLWQKNKDLH